MRVFFDTVSSIKKTFIVAWHDSPCRGSPRYARRLRPTLTVTLEQPRASARNAAAMRERMRKLAASGAVSHQYVQLAESEADTSAAQVALAQAQLERPIALCRLASCPPACASTAR